MRRRSSRLVRSWHPAQIEQARAPRNALVAERPDGTDRWVQAEGPFAEYERTLRTDGDEIVDTTTYRLVVPWFAWLFRWPVRSSLRHRAPGDGKPPAWAPPDRLTAHHAKVLGLLAAVSMTAAFVNTLFTQTASFAAKDFGISEGGQSIAGVIVRCGIVIALPFTILADRIGRRRVIVLLAWLAPSCAALGSLAPNFWVLTASQTLARPLGIALDLLIGVAAAEEMPRNSRAYAVSVLAMASGLGAGIAVMSLPLADVADWRLVYVVSLIWLIAALDISRRLTETPRFEHVLELHQVGRTHVDRRRFAIIASVAFIANLFIAPASYFQNRYLDDVRDYSATGITMFTITTATPASLGFVIGGKFADTHGRRRLLALSLPIATTALVVSFSIGGWVMWAAAFLGGLLGGMAYPAFSVYRAELFPTGRRGQANGMIAALALIGGSVGLLVAGQLLDHGWGYGEVMALLAVGQLVAAVIVFTTYPETAHRSLEEINPEDV
ncbi:MAG: MFS transporter [Ilumatobacteraceae bacterium]